MKISTLKVINDAETQKSVFDKTNIRCKLIKTIKRSQISDKTGEYII